VPVADQEQAAPPAPVARVIGRICAQGHVRLAYYEASCPLCACATLLCAAATRCEELIDQHHYMENEMQSLKDRLAENEN
jgi:hypothetical protein